MARVTFEFKRMVIMFFDDRFAVIVDKLTGLTESLTLDELEEALLKAKKIRESRT